MKLYHITKKIDWESAQQAGKYTTPSLAKEGFIHCSLLHQIPPVANFNFKGQQGLVLLEIAKDQLAHEVRMEDLYGEGKEYPHIYGPLNLNAVVRVVPFPPKEDGTFEVPEVLRTS